MSAIRSLKINCTGISIFLLAILAGCSPGKRIGKSAQQMLKDSAMASAHVGISIYYPASGKYLFEHQGDKFFVPASNTKLFTMYAGLKYLGDSIAGLRYTEQDTAVFIAPTGDPGFLHPDYADHPVLNFLQGINKPIYIDDSGWQSTPLGSGWSWGDYNAAYAPERSPFPVYGNVLRWIKEKSESSSSSENEFDQSVSIYSIPDINWPVQFDPGSARGRFYVQRDRLKNSFLIRQGVDSAREQEVPFVTDGSNSTIELLNNEYDLNIRHGIIPAGAKLSVVHSRHIDSLLRPLMHRSDNLYAEQVMLMVSEKLLGRMDEGAVIDSLLNTALAGLPANVRWADGSGLSRNNLFTPQSMVTILDKIEQEFGMDRVRGIMATGGEGTIRNFYHNQKGSIYAKTGTLSGVVALSGYLITKKKRMLLFSVLVNNHRANANDIRRQVERFIDGVYEKY